jgi:drug/metabolite transporter (DMT)-like permease
MRVKTGDLVAVTVWQYLGALLVTIPLALVLENGRFEINTMSIASLAWSVIALSMAGISMMLFLIREGSVARVSTLNFLVPPVAAVMAWLMFNELLTGFQIFGMIVTAIGVFLANRPDPQKAA